MPLNTVYVAHCGWYLNSFLWQMSLQQSAANIDLDSLVVQFSPPCPWKTHRGTVTFWKSWHSMGSWRFSESMMAWRTAIKWSFLLWYNWWLKVKRWRLWIESIRIKVCESSSNLWQNPQAGCQYHTLDNPNSNIRRSPVIDGDFTMFVEGKHVSSSGPLHFIHPSWTQFESIWNIPASASVFTHFHHQNQLNHLPWIP